MRGAIAQTIDGSGDLPYFMPPRLAAEVLQCSEKTLERRRRDGNDGIPFVKMGRRILYPRDLLLKHVQERIFTSTAEAKQAEKTRAAARREAAQ